MMPGVLFLSQAGSHGFVCPAPVYPLAMLTLAILFLIAILTRNERYHGALAIFPVVHLVVYPLTNLQTVR
jgi:hypothetical protein